MANPEKGSREPEEKIPQQIPENDQIKQEAENLEEKFSEKTLYNPSDPLFSAGVSN